MKYLKINKNKLFCKPDIVLKQFLLCILLVAVNKISFVLRKDRIDFETDSWNEIEIARYKGQNQQQKYKNIKLRNVTFDVFSTDFTFLDLCPINKSAKISLKK